jgi:hypothetical protein
VRREISEASTLVSVRCGSSSFEESFVTSAPLED